MLKDYGIDFDVFTKHEQAARECFPADFINKENILNLAREAQIPKENFDYLSAFLDYADEELMQFIWLLYYVQFESQEDFSLDYHSLDRWPMPQKAEEKFPGGVGAAVCLLSVENLKKWVEERNLGQDIIEGYYTRYRYFLELNGGNPGVLGLSRLKGFLYGYSKPFFIRLGRLAYEVAKFPKHLEAYENSQGKRVYMASEKSRFDSDGSLLQNGKAPIYEKSETLLRGQKISEIGRLENQITELDLTEYKLVLSNDDFVISIHIPEGGRLDETAVTESLNYAKDIFGKYFPRCKAFICHTWFIDPILVDEIIKPGGNMEKFANLFDKVGAANSYNGPIFELIFKTAPKPLNELVPTNDFQAKVLNRALRGEKMYWCYGVLK